MFVTSQLRHPLRLIGMVAKTATSSDTTKQSPQIHICRQHIQMLRPKQLFLTSNSDLNVPFCSKLSRKDQCSYQTASIQLKTSQMQKWIHPRIGLLAAKHFGITTTNQNPSSSRNYGNLTPCGSTLWVRVKRHAIHHRDSFMHRRLVENILLVAGRICAFDLQVGHNILLVFGLTTIWHLRVMYVIDQCWPEYGVLISSTSYPGFSLSLVQVIAWKANGRAVSSQATTWVAAIWRYFGCQLLPAAADGLNDLKMLGTQGISSRQLPFLEVLQTDTQLRSCVAEM